MPSNASKHRLAGCIAHAVLSFENLTRATDEKH